MKGSILLLVLLPQLLLATQNYTFNRLLELDLPVQKVAITQDLQQIILYSSSSQFVNCISGYNWTNCLNDQHKNFTFPLTYIDSYNKPNSAYQTYFVYTSVEGDIRLKYQSVQGAYVDGFVWTLEDQHNVIRRIQASPDRRTYVTFCKDDWKVYYGPLEIFGSKPKVIDYESNGIIDSVRWRTSSQVVVSGSNTTTDQRFFQIYDIDQKTAQDLVHLTEAKVVDMAFSKDGNTMYFIEETQSLNEQFIKIYNFKTNKSRLLVAPEAGQFLQINRRGNFLTTYDEDKVYVWNLVTQTFIGSYLSSMRSVSISSDGSILLTLSQSHNGAMLGVYTLCPRYFFYSSQSNQCEPCDTSCVLCQFNSTYCTRCKTFNYLDPNHICQSCIDHCVTCRDGKSCTQCQSDYFNNMTSCLLCSDYLKGCIECYNINQCRSCDARENWIVTPQLQCVCTERHIQINNKCQLCPVYCLKCSSQSVCITCDPAVHMIVNSQQYCECEPGYYFTSWAACLLCSEVIDNCVSCADNRTCLACKEGYTINHDTRICDINSTSRLAVILGVVIGLVALVIVGGIVKYKLHQRKKKQMSTMIESEETGTYYAAHP